MARMFDFDELVALPKRVVKTAQEEDEKEEEKEEEDEEEMTEEEEKEEEKAEKEEEKKASAPKSNKRPKPTSKTVKTAESKEEKEEEEEEEEKDEKDSKESEESKEEKKEEEEEEEEKAEKEEEKKASVSRKPQMTQKPALRKPAKQIVKKAEDDEEEEDEDEETGNDDEYYETDLEQDMSEEPDYSDVMDDNVYDPDNDGDNDAVPEEDLDQDEGNAYAEGDDIMKDLPPLDQEINKTQTQMPVAPVTTDLMDDNLPEDILSEFATDQDSGPAGRPDRYNQTQDLSDLESSGTTPQEINDQELEDVMASIWPNKPYALDPGVPVETNYFGPAPDAGWTVGSAYCPNCDKSMQIGVLASASKDTMFCPYCSTEAVYISDSMNTASIYDEMSAGTLIPLGICPQHGEMLTNASAVGESSYCPHCGQLLVAHTSNQQPGVTAVVIASPEDFNGGLRKEDVMLTLHHASTDNPWWNVIIQGQPVARVEFQAFDEFNSKADLGSAKKFFCSNDYQIALADAMVNMGLKETLNVQKAKIYVAQVDDTRKIKEIEVRANHTAENKIRAKVASVTEELVHNLSIAFQGMKKGIYQNRWGNPLKDAVSEVLASVGVYESETLAQKAIDKGLVPFLQASLVQAQEYMSMPEDARKEIEKFVSNASDVRTASAVRSPEDRSYRQVLTEANMPLVTAQTPQHNRPQSTQTTVDFYKSIFQNKRKAR